MHLSVLKTKPCVGSGQCCKHAACGFGEWDAKKHQCKFLEVAKVVDEVEIFRCGKYAEIIGQPSSEVSPAFGSGCCQSLFNTNRQRILRLVGEGRIDLPHGDSE
jgi:hypothetical protein